MKRIAALIFIVVICFLVSACGESESVKAVQELIASIGEVSLDSGEDIAAAEEAYEALSDREKEAVENYNELADARKAFDLALTEQEENNKKIYDQAVVFLENGDLYHAATTFYSIAGYADAREKCFETWHKITGYHTIEAGPLAIRTDGSLWANEKIPSEAYSWKNLVSIRTGDYGDCIFALTEDGHVLSTVKNMDLSSWTDIVAISTLRSGTVVFGIKADGTVMTNSRVLDLSKWSDIVQIAPGETGFVIGLKNDGTLVGVSDEYGGLNLSGISDVVQISAGRFHTVALRKDGTVVTFNTKSLGTYYEEPEWHDVVAVYANDWSTVVIQSDGTVLADSSDLSSNVAEALPELHDVSQLVIDSPWVIAIGRDGTLQTNYHTVHTTDTYRKPDVFYAEYAAGRSVGEVWRMDFEMLLRMVFGHVTESSWAEPSTEDPSRKDLLASGFGGKYYSITLTAPENAKGMTIDFSLSTDQDGAAFFYNATFDGFKSNLDRMFTINEGSKTMIVNLWKLGIVMSGLAGEAVPPNANIDILLDSRDGAQKIGYWEITSALDKSGQRVLFHAVYSGSESGIVILPGFLVPPAEENDDINSKVIHFLQKNSKASLQSILDMASAFENAQEDAFSYVDSWGN